jgi:hypothetical protein
MELMEELQATLDHGIRGNTVPLRGVQGKLPSEDFLITKTRSICNQISNSTGYADVDITV